MNIHLKHISGMCFPAVDFLSIKLKELKVLTVFGLIFFTMSSYSFSPSKLRLQVQKSMVPFKGDYIVSIRPLGMPPIQQISVNGEGHATHLGKSKFEMMNTANFTTLPITLSGSGTFYAANGDRIFTSVSGSSTPNGDGSATAVIENTIIGGTGKFKDASGNFVGTTIATIGQPSIEITFEGTISY